MDNLSIQMMSVMKRTGDQDSYLQMRLEQLIKLFIKVSSRYGGWDITSKQLLTIYRNRDSYTDAMFHTTSLIQVCEKSNSHIDHKVDELTQEFYDEKWLNAMCLRMNSILDYEERVIFFDRYLKKKKVDQIIRTQRISRRKYYEVLRVISDRMIQEFSLDLYDANGNVKL